MKSIITFCISILISTIAYSQKKTETYIKEARKVAKSWLADVNNEKFANAYSLLHQESIPKKNNDSIMWCKYMILEQVEFGEFKKRNITNAQFVPEIQDQESGNKISGFFVFLEYTTEYQNIKTITETILLQQNDQTKWEILNYTPVWLTPSSEEEKTLNQNKK
ncbi:MAG: DUF4019 domain-containing protein [Bacteroidota bacterium]|nr:DUF4019 domain-containing protein [Bacteroidota bacterium]